MSDPGEERIAWRLISERGLAVWQAGYRGYYARADTREAAYAELSRQLRAAGIDPPPNAGGGGLP